MDKLCARPMEAPSAPCWPTNADDAINGRAQASRLFCIARDNGEGAHHGHADGLQVDGGKELPHRVSLDKVWRARARSRHARRPI